MKPLPNILLAIDLCLSLCMLDASGAMYCQIDETTKLQMVREAFQEKLWDTAICVRPVDEKKNLTAGRTHRIGVAPDLTNGSYELHGWPTFLKGPEINRVRVFEIKAGKVDSLELNFDSGEAFIGATHEGALVDATVTIYAKEARKNVASGRTYKHGKTNPKKFVLQPGLYIVEMKALSADVRGIKKSFEMTIKAGEAFRKTVAF
ncbi:MAG: hypothetical protein AAF990_05195 [Bacteroidota bacterium]